MLCVFHLKKSKEISQIYCFPGNAGTNQIATNVEINLNDFEQLKNFIIKRKNNLCSCRSRKTSS